MTPPAHGAPDPHAPSPATDPLSPRQREVARLYGTGAPHRAIAAALGLSPRTVQRHLEEMGRRLDGDGTLRQRVLAYLLRTGQIGHRLSA